jgi:hypothetical protein
MESVRETFCIQDFLPPVTEPTVCEIAEVLGWDDVKRFGRGGLTTQTLEIKGWLIMPVGVFEGNIPQEAIHRAKIVKERIRIKGFLIADDKRHRRYQPKKQVDRDKLLLVGATAAGLMGTVVFGLLVFGVAIPATVVSTPVVTAGVAATGATASAPLLVPLLAAAVVMDPVLICVTMADEWIALYRWDD